METFLFILILLSQIADISTTVYALRHGFQELNPVMLWLQNKLGIFWGIPKVLLILLAASVLYTNTSALIALLVVSLGFVVNNIVVLLKGNK